MLNIRCVSSLRKLQMVHIIGRFVCNGNPVNNVMVTLFHRNRFGGPSLLGKLPCDENGLFDLQGNKKLFLGMGKYLTKVPTK
uniref:ZP domain-containing protein n=1 Tax=Strongyloides papillosus TaxID=174720 RepID=A0A0N5BLH2_STREA